MAERRMFARAITESDAFSDMPVSAQCLYFHLGMNADDDGFIGNPKRVTRMVGAQDDDLKLLIAKRFLLVFEDGIVVIKHWKMCNYIQKDRYKPTVYQEDAKLLFLKANRAYTFDASQAVSALVSNVYPECIQESSTMDTQYSIGKNSIDKNSKDKKNRGTRPQFVPPELSEVIEYAASLGYEGEATRFVNYYEASGWTRGKGAPVKSWKPLFRNWIKQEWAVKDKPIRTTIPDYGNEWVGDDDDIEC